MLNPPEAATEPEPEPIIQGNTNEDLIMYALECRATVRKVNGKLNALKEWYRENDQKN